MVLTVGGPSFQGVWADPDNIENLVQPWICMINVMGGLGNSWAAILIKKHSAQITSRQTYNISLHNDQTFQKNNVSLTTTI